MPSKTETVAAHTQTELKGSSANDSSSAADTADAIANDGEYIVIVQYDSTGENVEGYAAIPNSEFKAVILDAAENGHKNALATYQNDEGNFQIAESQYEGVIYTSLVLIIAVLFMCLGAIASRTLLKSFER